MKHRKKFLWRRFRRTCHPWASPPAQQTPSSCPHITNEWAPHPYVQPPSHSSKLLSPSSARHNHEALHELLHSGLTLVHLFSHFPHGFVGCYQISLQPRYLVLTRVGIQQGSLERLFLSQKKSLVCAAIWQTIMKACKEVPSAQVVN